MGSGCPASGGRISGAGTNGVRLKQIDALDAVVFGPTGEVVEKERRGEECRLNATALFCM